VVRRLFAAILAAVLLGGCGTPGADLLVARRTGSIPGAALTMRVIDDGQVVCNGAQHPISSDLLIDARELVRELAEPAKVGTDLPPGRGTILRYRIRTEDGTVAFSDTSRGQPPAFYRAALLVRQIAKGPCGLER
jgi:hypothetical protein